MRKACKRAYIMVCIMFSALLLAMPIYAQENKKEVQVPIAKDYKSAKFTLNFEYYENYGVSIQSPDGNSYEGEYKGGTVVECVVNDVKAGQWQVIITKPDDAKQPQEDAPNSDDEQTGEDDTAGEQREISPVKIQVEGSKESIVDVDKDITVATDIAGLKMYFRDSDFVAEWTDTTCGSVNIEIINAKNLQKLDAQTINGNSYSYAIDESIKEIIVNIVPSVSANIEGATKSYAFTNDYNPDATVAYEDISITNHDTILVSCHLNSSYCVLILVNGKETEKTDLLGKGDYEYRVPISIGTNEITTYIVDKQGNMKSTSSVVEKDVIAPGLNLVSDYKNITTENESIVIEGAVSDCDKLQINNAEVKIEGDNTFSYEYGLKEGINDITICASDLAGNETTYNISVKRNIPSDKMPMSAIIILVILLIAVALLLGKKRPKANSVNLSAPDADNDSDDKNNSDMPEKEEEVKEESKKPRKKEKEVPEKQAVIAKAKRAIAFNRYCDIFSFVLPIVLLYIVITQVFTLSVVISGSMEPTLAVGDTVIYNRLAYKAHDPQRGDIVAFYSREGNSLYAKRIIGVPGDEISFSDGYVVINGQYCEESYIDSEIETNSVKTFVVPDGCYFMLGDNREQSNDSRYWDNPYIAKEDIIGKYIGQCDFSFKYDVIYRLFPNNK